MSALSNLSFDLASLHAAYAHGLSAEALVEEVYRRVDALGDPGIFLYRIPLEEMLHAARALDEQAIGAKPLWGVPFVVKDNIDVAGVPTTAACPAFSYVAKCDAFVVQQLREAGALLVGKTNLDQFATGLVGVRTPHPVPLNAIDPDIVPGGSSSGSAVAVARGLVSFALGTDTAGSGRVPAALNNIVGLKPTLGTLSATGVVPACKTLDTISVFALNVGDAYLAYRTATCFDETDPFSRKFAVAPLPVAQARLRVAVPTLASREFFGDDTQAVAFEAALGQLCASGAQVREIDLAPFMDVAKMLYQGAWVAERMTVVEALLSKAPTALHPVTRAVIESANELSAMDVFRDTYQLRQLKREIELLLQDIDLLCVPSIPTFYSVADVEGEPVLTNSRLGTYTNFVNLLDMCALTVPTQARTDGRPGSVTLIARAGDDARVAGLGAQLHEGAGVTAGATNWSIAASDLLSSSVAPHEMAIAVVGAHMRGLPLNGQLSERGGRFLRATRTAPNYRLYSLPGGPPLRPGLIRGENGSAIELEIWSLPREQMGDFLAGIPAPLAIGTVETEDGDTVNGFLCESAAAAGARDITEFGGWRRFLDQVSAENR